MLPNEQKEKFSKLIIILIVVRLFKQDYKLIHIWF